MLAADQQGLIKTNIDALAPQLLSTLSSEENNAQHMELNELRIGAFCLKRELGRGGMGTVWLADRVNGEIDRHAEVSCKRLCWCQRGFGGQY